MLCWKSIPDLCAFLISILPFELYPQPHNITGSRDITSLVSISRHAHPEKLSPLFYPYKKMLIFCKIPEPVRLFQPLHTLSSAYFRELSPSCSQISKLCFAVCYDKGVWESFCHGTVDQLPQVIPSIFGKKKSQKNNSNYYLKILALR